MAFFRLLRSVVNDPWLRATVWASAIVCSCAKLDGRRRAMQHECTIIFVGSRELQLHRTSNQPVSARRTTIIFHPVSIPTRHDE